jgi:hypothetical protein
MGWSYVRDHYVGGRGTPDVRLSPSENDGCNNRDDRCFFCEHSPPEVILKKYYRPPKECPHYKTNRGGWCSNYIKTKEER